MGLVRMRPSCASSPPIHARTVSCRYTQTRVPICARPAAADCLPLHPTASGPELQGIPWSVAMGEEPYRLWGGAPLDVRPSTSAKGSASAKTYMKQRESESVSQNSPASSGFSSPSRIRTRQLGPCHRRSFPTPLLALHLRVPHLDFQLLLVGPRQPQLPSTTGDGAATAARPLPRLG